MTTTATRSPFKGYMKDIEARDVSEALTLAGLDFTVQKAPLYAAMVDTFGVDQVEIEGKAGILRDDNGGYRSLGVASWDYGIIQNHEAFEPIDYLAREGFITRIVQAGSVGHGRRVFMLAELAGECRLRDPHQRMVMFATTHDGTGSFTVRGWMNRLHCTNQIPAVFGRKKGDWISKVNHTSRAATYLAGVRAAVVQAIEGLEQYDDIMQELTSLSLSSVDVEEFLTRLFPLPPLVQYTRDHDLAAGERRTKALATSKRDVVRSLVNGEHNEGLHGTRAALFHGAVEYSDYYARGDNAQRILNGTDIKFKTRALELAMA